MTDERRKRRDHEGNEGVAAPVWVTVQDVAHNPEKDLPKAAIAPKLLQRRATSGVDRDA
jgi:hypothetical protein